MQPVQRTRKRRVKAVHTLPPQSKSIGIADPGESEMIHAQVLGR
jgi:hypothetical protein